MTDKKAKQWRRDFMTRLQQQATASEAKQPAHDQAFQSPKLSRRQGPLDFEKRLQSIQSTKNHWTADLKMRLISQQRDSNSISGDGLAVRPRHYSNASSMVKPPMKMDFAER